MISVKGGVSMDKTQQFVSILAALVAGVGLVVSGVVMGNEAMLAVGTGLIGLFTGAVGIKRPTDIV